MTILNPDHLFEQATRLMTATSAGPPRQVDLRRAVSSVYYGVFHAIAGAAADEFIGATKRTTSWYGLVYRSADHRQIRELCEDLQKSTMPSRYAAYIPVGGFQPNLAALARAIIELQGKRHTADYDPLARMRVSDVVAAVQTARAALAGFRRIRSQRRQAFLTLLLFPPRR